MAAPNSSDATAEPTEKRSHYRRYRFGVVIILAIVPALWFLTVEVAHWSERGALREVVAEIQQFQTSHRRLPNFAELAHGAAPCEGRDSFLKGRRCMFYRTHGGRYVVGYSVGTDEDVYFDSATGELAEGLSPSWSDSQIRPDGG